MKVPIGLDDLKYLTKSKSMLGYVQDDPDLGVFEIRYDIRSNRFLIANSSREWMIGIKDVELFQGDVAQARAIGQALNSHKLILLEGNERKETHS